MNLVTTTVNERLELRYTVIVGRRFKTKKLAMVNKIKKIKMSL